MQPQIEIIQLKFWTLQVPLKKPYKVAMGVGTHTNNIVVSLTAMDVSRDQLIEGWGEADPLDGFTPETVESIKDTLKKMVPVLLGQNALDINRLNILMRSIVPHSPLAIGSVDMALWDIMGKYKRAPVYTLLGGHCGRTSFPLLWPLSSQSAADDLQQLPSLIDQGYRTFMLKMGGADDDITAQIDRIRTINESYPDGELFICTDANQGWNIDQATTFVRGISTMGGRVDFFEQPLQCGREEEMILLRRAWEEGQCSREDGQSVSVKFSADESAQTLSQVSKCLQTNDFDYISLKVSKNGGISRMKEIASACAVMGKAVLVNSMLELGITQAAALHVAATCEHLLPCGHCFMSTLRCSDDVTNFRTLIQDAVVHLPSGDKWGLGITVEVDKLEQYSVCPVLTFKKASSDITM